MRIKFKKKKRVLKPGYSLDPVKLKFIGGQHKHPILKPRPIIPRSTSLLARVSYNKPVKRYWGDYDKDGVINGLDCVPRDPKKQGPQHKRRRKTLTKEQADSLFKSGGTPLIKSEKQEHDEIDDLDYIKSAKEEREEIDRVYKKEQKWLDGEEE